MRRSTRVGASRSPTSSSRASGRSSRSGQECAARPGWRGPSSCGRRSSSSSPGRTSGTTPAPPLRSGARSPAWRATATRRCLGSGATASTDPLPHVVLEYVDGPTVAEVVDETGPQAAADVAQLGAQLLPALLALHDRGLAHLDVKAENVILRDGRPVLIDLGSSRAIGSEQPAGRPVGTSGYAAPEMEACEPISAQMDLYGLGTVLAEALTGAPFPDRSPLPPEPLSDLVTRLLSDDPAARGTVQQALLDLAACCDPEPWPTWAGRLLAAAERQTLRTS